MDSLCRRLLSAALAGCLGVALAGCSGDAKTAEGAEETVEDYVEAFADGRGGAACDFLTEEYAEDLVADWTESGFSEDEEGFGDDEEDCDSVVEASAVFIEGFSDDELEIDDISADVDGDEATVTVEYNGDDFGDETYHLVYDDGDWLIDDEGDSDDEVVEESDDPGAENEFDEPTPTEVESTPIAAPLAIGETGSAGDWEVRVIEVDDDATELITKPRYYNSKPRETYVLVTFEATYIGPDRSADSDIDLTWTLTTADQQIHDESGATTVADAQDWPTEARSGGTITDQAVFDVDPAQLAGALVSAETYNDDGEEEYVDFAL